MESGWKLKLACVWGGELVSVLTSSILQMGFVWHITLTTNSASMLSLASLAGFLPLALFGTFAGTIVDRLPLKVTLIGADLFIAAVSAVVAAISLTGTLPVWVVMVALFVRAIGSSLHTPAFQALTPLVAPAEHLTRLAGVTQAVQSGGYILERPARVIYPLWGLTAMIALDVAGALFATVAVLAARLDVGGAVQGATAGERNLGLVAQARALAAETADGYRVLRGYRGLFRAFVVRLRLHAGLLAHIGALPAHDARPLRGHHGRRRDGRDRLLGRPHHRVRPARGDRRLPQPARSPSSRPRRCSGAATCVSGLLGTDGFPVFVAMSLLMGVSSPFFSGAQTSLMQEKVRPECLGRVFGLYGAIMSWAMPVGLVFSSLFADAVGAAPWFAGAGAIMMALAAVTWLIPSIRGIERER